MLGVECGVGAAYRAEVASATWEAAPAKSPDDPRHRPGGPTAPAAGRLAFAVMRARTRPFPVHYAQGLLMGGADVIPGVSGGTVALIIGIYESLISSVRAAASAPVRLLRGDVQGTRERLAEVQWGLVLPLAAGIVTALGVGSFVLPYLLERYPAQMSAAFLGLVAGSLAVPWRRIDRVTAAHAGVVALAGIAAFVLVGLPPQTVPNPGLGQVFASAAVAICAMILPGISGAFLLKVLGLYETTLGALRTLDVGYVAVFVLGAAVGLGLFARLLEHLLDRHHDMTMAALVGLMAGSLRALWPWLDADRGFLPPPADAGAVAAVVALALAGFALVTLLTRAGAATEDADLTPDPDGSDAGAATTPRHR